MGTIMYISILAVTAGAGVFLLVSLWWVRNKSGRAPSASRHRYYSTYCYTCGIPTLARYDAHGKLVKMCCGFRETPSEKQHAEHTE